MMLITRPNHDVTTDYLYFWSQPIIDYAERIKINIIDLSKKRANFKEFNSVIKKRDPSFLVLNGHGSESTVSGYNNEPLIESGKNTSILNGKIVYARSCSSAKKLGKDAVKDGCKVYIGYDDEFVFMIEDDKIFRPREDQTASIFLMPANQVAISLLKGHTSSESNEKSKELHKKQILKFMTSEATSEEREFIPLLIWNYQHQVCLGDQNAKVL